ncbi:MAG TPA: hypothetical protein VJO15_00730 [Dehalococcoidia bacterium]|nr:hypothetical protein [Dehalococcoidia bacterium]
MLRRLPLALALVILLATAFVSSAFLDGGLSQRLEDWTGETELKQQLVAIYSELSQRRLETEDLVPMAHAGLNPYGVNVFLEQEVEEWKLERSMEMIRQSGARWIRLHVPWADLELPAKGQYLNPQGTSTWEKYDRIVGLAGQYGINVLARLDDPPDWTRTDNSVHNRPPDDFEDFGDFVATFVARYRGRISYYQIWNEPNVYPEWGNQPVSAVSYVELLRTAYLRAKAADPESVIVAAPLAPTLGTDDGYNEGDLVFLQKMYDAGARDYFDVMSVNAYGLWTGPGDRRVEEERTNFSRPLLVRELMVRNGDAGKPMWATEMGWNALPVDFPGPATHGRVSLDRQASYTAAAYRRALEEWPWMGVIFYWHFRMVRDEPDQVVYYYRMAEPDFTPLPVYDAFRHLANEPPVLYYGYHQEDHRALTYDGAWERIQDPRALLGAYAQATAPGARLSFTFKGTGLVLVAAQGQGGRAYVTVDGSPAAGQPGGRAYPGPTSPELRPGQAIPLARGLAYGDHYVEITSASPGFALDGLIVEKEGREWWRPLAGLGLLLVSLIVLVWAYRRQ